MSSRRVLAENGVLRVEQDLHIAKREIATDVSGPAVVYARVEVRRGKVVYLRDGAEIVAPALFSVVIPPFSIVQARLERCDVSIEGVAFRPVMTVRLPSSPLLVEKDQLIDIDRAPNPHDTAAAAKRILDSEYASGARIGVIAQRLSISASTLARLFAKSFGIPPVRYRRHLQVMDALLRFAAGSSPIDVCHDVGFEDLSRFYDAFRTIACSPPGPYRPAGSKNAKTGAM